MRVRENTVKAGDVATQTKTKTTRNSAAASRRPVAARASSPATPAGRRRRGAKNLVIVESPTKARTIGSILGEGYEVIASMGHVRDLPAYGYGVKSIKDLDFTPLYVVPKDKREVVAQIAEAARTAERVYLSTDPDREGEAISWHIKEVAEIPDGKAIRVVFHEITKPAIQAAFREAEAEGPGSLRDGDHRGKLDLHLVDAQQTRRVLDRLIGFPLTWFVQGKVTKSASAGRVQSVALRLIVERERVIQAFRPQEYWTIHALLAKGSAAFTADLARIPGKKGKLAIADEPGATRLVEAFRRSDFAVSEVKKGERRTAPFPPFTTSTFQQAAINRLGLSASRAMAIAQQLYEGVSVPGEGPVGLISYMRTDSLNVSPLARAEARQFVAGRWGADHVPPKERVYRTRSKGAQEAHEAIRPTNPGRTPESLRHVLDAPQLRVYTLIWQRFLASQMSDAQFATVTVEIEAREGDQVRGVFKASAQHLLFPGHLAAYGVDASERSSGTDDEDAESSLPELVAGEALERRAVDARQHFTEPPPRFTEASLVKALEELGIGRPSTYATIVRTVQKREYVKREGRALVPQELGFLVNDLLVNHLDRYVATDFTSKMEDQLDEIAGANAEYLPVVREFWRSFGQEIERAKDEADKIQEETQIVCSACGEARMMIKWGRNGKFLACPRYPDCKNAMPLTSDGEPAPRSEPALTAYGCPKCGSTTVQRTGPYGPYIDCTGRDSGQCDFRAGVPVGVVCPEEPESGQLVEKRTRRGIFYGCWNYPHCSYTTNTLEPGKMARPRNPEERAAANKKLLERSARGKAAFATRRARVATSRKAS